MAITINIYNESKKYFLYYSFMNYNRFEISQLQSIFEYFTEIIIMIAI